LQGLAAAAQNEWRRLAKRRLRSTSATYVDAIKMEQSTEGRVTLTLRGTLPNMIEQGWPGGDMRDWMLRSPKAKQGAKGPYLTIPFRHGTPDSGGRNVGPQMPGAIYQAAKQLDAYRPRMLTHHRGQGGRHDVHNMRLRPHAGMKDEAKRILGRLEKPWHATSIYMDMVRKQQPTRTGGQTSGYTTWRTISAVNREPGKHWQHPGLKPKHIARDVQKYIGTVASAVVSQSIQSGGTS
jgi:hypothetical protein